MISSCQTLLSNTPVKHSCQTLLSNTATDSFQHFQKDCKETSRLDVLFYLILFLSHNSFHSVFLFKKRCLKKRFLKKRLSVILSLVDSFVLWTCKEDEEQHVVSLFSECWRLFSESSLTRELCFPCFASIPCKTCFPLESLSLQEENKTIIRTRVKMAS